MFETAQNNKTRSFRCLLVDYIGNDQGQSFLIVKNDEDSVTDLAFAIREMNKEVLHDVSAPRLNLWKPNSLDAFPLDTISLWVKTFLNSRQDQRDGVQLDMGARLRVAFPPGQSLQESLPSEQIHVIAQLPLDKLVLRNAISFRSFIKPVLTRFFRRPTSYRHTPAL